ncbi:MAG TPA: DUF418 domain-containing protein [Chryseolinea sp.]
MTTASAGISPSLIGGPVMQSERIILLDSLRGIAVLGILLMNIPGFALPYIQIYDPAVRNELAGPNYYAYYFVELVLEGSQRAIFTMLFGAGMLLFLGRMEKKVDGLMVAEFYFRRQLWLLAFGLFNAYVLLWFWDVLYHYAILGMLLFPFRRVTPKALLIGAGFCLVMMTARENLNFYREKGVIHRGEAVAAIDTTKVKLSDAQKEDLLAMQGLKEESSKESKERDMKKNERKVLGSYADLYQDHSERSYRGETAGVFHFLFWDALIFMFIGMAFYKTGIITGTQPARTYAWLCIVGLGIGLPISYFRLQPLFEHGFNFYSIAKHEHFEFYELSRVFRSLGIFGAIMLLYKSGWFKWLFAIMRPVGQMAFTNYLMQSFLCGLIFYGIGFGLFGKLQRYEMYYVVLGVWIFQILFSHVWLRYFQFGPLEWIWRSLTYWKNQPLKKLSSV